MTDADAGALSVQVTEGDGALQWHTATSYHEQHYELADPDRENAPWCKVCRGPHECEQCDLEFDSRQALNRHYGEHASKRSAPGATELATDDWGPEDFGLSPMGDRKGAGD